MKKRIKKIVAFVLAAAITLQTPLAGVKEVKAADSELVSVSVDEDAVTIGNKNLSREFSIADKMLSTTKISNKLGNSEFYPQEGTEEFVIKTMGTTTGQGTTLEDYTTSEGTIDHVFDGIKDVTGNFWISGSEDMKLIVNFGETKEVKTVVYTPRYDNGAKYDCTGRLTKMKIQYWDSETEAWIDAAVNGDTEISLVSDKEVKPDAIDLDTAVVTSKIKLVGIESYHWQDGNRNKFMNVGELDILDSEGVTVIQKAEEISEKEIKASELTLSDENGVIVSDTEATINGVDKTGKMITFTFDPVDMGTGKASVIEKVVMYDGDHFMRKFLEISSSDKTVRINYIDGEHLMVGDSDKTWTIPTGVGGIVEMSEYKANLGQPIYINGMFLGSEFPETDTQIESNLGHIRYFTGKNFTDFSRDGQLTENGTYVSWQTVLGASRSDGSDMGVIQSDFYEYINSIATPSDFRLQYNSWFDNMMYIDDENILSSFTEIEKELTQSGVRPMDSYVVDDGWNNYHYTSVFDTGRSGTTLNTDGFWTFNSKFSDGFTPSSDLVNKLGSDFGVWIGPRGGYNYYGQLADILVANGNGSKAGGSIDVADSRYLEKYEEMAIQWMEKYGINYWKWDGFADNAQYNAFPSGEGVVGYSESNRHMYGGKNHMYHVTDLWEKWIVLMEHVRDAEDTLGINNLWISLTCYTNPSPWFLQWANSVWMQCAGDRGEISNGTLNNKMDNMLTYRDANYYEFVEVHQFQFPLANLYNHDPIYGKTDTGITASSMTAEQFKNYLYMMGTRGTAFWELYYSDSLLDQDKYLVNAEFLEWAEKNFDILRNAKMIGDHPSDATRLNNYRNGGLSSGETQNPYGFSCFNGGEGILSMRNPAAVEKTITFTLNDDIGVTVDGTYYMNTVHTYSPTTVTDAKTTYKKGETVTVTLQPGEVQIWSLSLEPDATAPKFKTLTTVSEKELQLQIDEKLKGTAAFEISVNGEKADVTVSEYSDLRTFKLVFTESLNDGDVIKVSAVQGADSAGNVLTGEISSVYYEENKIAETEKVTESLQLISSADRSVAGTNGFTVTVSVQTDDKDVVLVKQGDAYCVGINSEGHPYFTMNGTTVTSKTKVSGDYVSVISAVRENNGLIRLYIDGQIQNSVYDEKNKEYEIQKADITANIVNGTIEKVVIYDRSLGYDEVPNSELGELVSKISSEKDLWTEDSWSKADMNTVLANAETAIKSKDINKINEAAIAVNAAYKTLVPQIYKNLAYEKTITAAWMDGTTTNVTNAGSPLSNAVDGKYNDAAKHAIFGKDGVDDGVYIQIDLGEQCDITNVKLWRYWSDDRTYKTTALVVSDTDQFENKQVLYYSGESDIYNLGVTPTEELYMETSDGKVLYDGQIVTGRYVRLYMHGKVADTATENHVVELQVNGKVTGYDPYNLKEYKKTLENAKAEAAKTDIYTVESIAALNEQIALSENLIAELEGATESTRSWAEVAEKLEVLKTTLDGLQKIPVDKSALNSVIETVEKLNPDSYTEGSWGNLESELEKAKEVQGNAEATLEEVAAATETLSKAMDNLVAYFQVTAEGEGCEITVTVKGNKDAKKLELDDEVTVTAVVKDGYEFSYWLDKDTKQIASTEKSFTFYTIKNTNLKAVCVKDEKETVTVEFKTGKSFGNTVLYSADVEKGTKVEVPNAPELTGYQFIGWDANGDGIAETITDGKVSADVNVTYVALYKAKEVTYTINVTGGTLKGTEQADEEGKYAMDTLLGIVADEVNEVGQTFAGWYDGDTLISLNTTYYFYVKKDMNLEAKYTDAEVESVPTLAFVSHNRYFDSSSNKEKIAMMISWDSAEGCTVLQKGFIRTCDKTLATVDNMVVGTTKSGISVKSVNAAANYGTYTYTLSMSATSSYRDQDFYVRGFIRYKNADGVIKTLYTGIETIGKIQ